MWILQKLVDRIAWIDGSGRHNCDASLTLRPGFIVVLSSHPKPLRFFNRTVWSEWRSKVSERKKVLTCNMLSLYIATQLSNGFISRWPVGELRDELLVE
jgi:hypothetical protein